MTGIGKTIRIGLSRGALEIKQFNRQREAVVFTIFFPLILLFIFGSIFSNEIAPSVTFSQYFVAGMIASGLVNSGFQNLAISIPMERDNGTLKRLRGTPMPLGTYFIGKSIQVLYSMSLQIILLLGCGALFFDLPLPSEADRWFTFSWVILLGTLCATVLGIAFSSVPKNGRSASAVVSPIVIILQFFSGVFFVFSQLPGWMQQFAAIFPLKWMTQGMRAVFLPDTFATQEVAGSYELGRIALILSIWTVVGLVIAMKSFKWVRR